MSTNDLEVAFQTWLDEPWERNYSARQMFWFAWKAGADWALDAVRKQAGLPPSSVSAGAKADD